MYNGIINIYKEAGFTSHDVVAKMRGILKQKKIGHTGTLDPEAVGVLPVCLGSGTKLCDMLTERDKEYEAKLLLGISTDTQDTTGAILSEKQVNLSEEEVREAILSFVGIYAQIPPMYSALKVEGKKLYELARAGKEVERKAREIRIHTIQIVEIQLPYVTMRVSCSKGTYIRTLCHDIGEKLGCGGAMAHLKRTKVGMFEAADAITLTELEQIREEGKVGEKIVAVDAIFSDLQAIHVKEEFTKLIDNGNAIYPNQVEEKNTYTPLQKMRVYNSKNQFYGVYEYEIEKKRIKPVKMFLSVE